MIDETMKVADLSSSKEEEVFPGVTERRHFLRSSLIATAAAIALSAAGVRAAGPVRKVVISGSEQLSWDDFLKLAVPVAQQLFADPGFTVDEYLYRIGSLATRLKEIPDTKLFPYTAIDKRVFFAPSFRGKPFFIIQWRLEPGATLPAHNHPNASVCTLGYEGEVRLRNFEIVGEAPPYATKKSFQVRETHSQLMAHGRINALSPTRDNIHFFQAGKEGARGIDITTMHGKMEQFSFLEIAEKPSDARRRVFEASWSEKGRKPEPAMRS